MTEEILKLIDRIDDATVKAGDIMVALHTMLEFLLPDAPGAKVGAWTVPYEKGTSMVVLAATVHKNIREISDSWGEIQRAAWSSPARDRATVN